MGALRKILLLVVAAVLAGCQLPALSGDELPTTLPTEMLPTVIALTVQAAQPTPTVSPAASPLPQISLTPAPSPTNSRTPTRTPFPTRTPTFTLVPSLTPTVTLTPRPEIPNAAIRINRPGPQSRLTSPMQVRAILAPGAGGIFRLELLGEDGRLLASKTLTYRLGDRVNLSTDLEFGVPGVAEAGRLQIITLDEFERVIALGSVNIVLMSVGPDEITTAVDLRARIFPMEPAAGSIVSGGTLFIYGKAKPNPQMTLLVELITPERKVVGQRVIGITPEAGEDYGIFSGEIPYTVSAETPVRVTIYERGDRIPGDTTITTYELILLP